MLYCVIPLCIFSTNYLSLTKIEVDDIDVGGTLVNEIDYVPMLDVFNMDGNPNHIADAISSQLGNLTFPRELDLDENDLMVSIQEEIYLTAKSLQQFDFDSSHLSCTISTEIGTLTDLWFV